MSIRLRFTFALTAVGLVLFGTYAVWAYRAERDELHSAAKSSWKVLGRSLETSLGNALRDKQPADIEEMLATLEALAPDLDVHIYDEMGAPLAHSQGSDLIEASLATRGVTMGRDKVTFDDDRIVFSGPIRRDDGVFIGSILVVRPIGDIKKDLEHTRNRLVLALVMFLVATTIAGLVLGTLHVGRPISRLLDGVRRVREGEFRTRVPAARADEIGELVVEFNAMIEALATSRAQMENESDARARLEAGLQRVDKLVTIGQLSAGLAHEIGSPLQVLSGRASVLLDHADPEVRRQAGLLVGQCDRITRVVEQLLSFGRRKPGVRGPCDLVVPVVAVIDLLGPEARRRGIKLELSTSEGLPAMIGDIDQLQQVTLNLVRNALNATPAGGTIRVGVDHTVTHVRLTVKDTGAGMDAETRAHLFEPFFTTRASEGGTGLGLAVVRAIVNEHSATIDIVSEPGAGAEFIVSFPVEGSRG